MIKSASLLQKGLTTSVKPAVIQLKHLPYDLNALEPVISGHLLDFHYGKHHRSYVNNLNQLIEQAQEAMAKNDIAKTIEISKALKFNGGGHFNHEFFWDSLCAPKDSHRPDHDTQLMRFILKTWDSFEQFEERFEKRTAAIQGSGWGWLAYNKKQHRLQFSATANQDLITDGNQDLVPILNMDVWEHAYYIDYKNARPVFLKQMWKVVNWEKVGERLAAAVKEHQPDYTKW